MSHEAGVELERLGITRVPKGTTSSDAGKQHTGTGLVERHIGLLKLTMQKLEAELDRTNVPVEIGELAAEAAMAQNCTLNYGGCTPSMSVFGVLPRPFYEDGNESIAATAGALQTDLTAFEKALRVRQLALSCVHRAVAEDRIAKANRTRTHQVRTEALIPGTTQLDFYRDVPGDNGWRGPAELLKVDANEGTVILTYQGRPYLVSLRHVRPHTAGVFLTVSVEQMEGMQNLRQLAERHPPYKTSVYGWVLEKKAEVTSWRRASATLTTFAGVWTCAVQVAGILSSQPFGGIVIGQAVRTVRPPQGSIGVLIFWTEGSENYACLEHGSDQPLKIKKATPEEMEKICFVYFFFYPNTNDDQARRKATIVPPEGIMDATSEHDEQSSNVGVPEGMDVDGDGPNEEKKRKGPETRTVTLGPESKKQKLDCLLDHLYVTDAATTNQHDHINLHSVCARTRQCPTEFPDAWLAEVNQPAMAQWDDHMGRSSSPSRQTTGAATSSLSSEDVPGYRNYLVELPGKKFEQLYVDILDGSIYKVDEETDILAENDCYKIWEQVERADAAEVSQFVETKAFRKLHRRSLDADTVVVDAVWVRKWKRMPDGSRKVKSRLCARGCFDTQRDMLATRSTTATRLSQRLLISLSVNEGFDNESWDISGAFLKGLDFRRVQELLRSKGI
jgi:hypothetical protein